MDPARALPRTLDVPVPGLLRRAIDIAAAAVLSAISVLALTNWLREDLSSTVRRDSGGADLTPDPAAVRYRFAIQPGRDGELEETIHALAERVRRLPGSPIEMAELADLYLRRGQRDGNPDDLSASEAMARRSLDILPHPNGALLTRARVASARHQFREAIALAGASLVRSRTAGALTVTATAHLALGELGEAAAAAEAAVELAPGTGTYLVRALVMQAQGRDPEAAFDFARAAAVEEAGDPAEGARIRTLWARFLVRRGELGGAGVLLDEALRIAPGSPLALAQQGERALRRGSPRDARVLFEHAFAGSRQVRYLIDLARAQELDGDPAADATRGHAEVILRAELAQHGVGHRLELVEVLVDRGRAGDLTEAIALAREEVALRPSADSHFQLARALLRARQRELAAVHVHAALATGARDARLFELAARVASGPRAAVYRREARRMDSDHSTWRHLGMEPIAPTTAALR